MIGRDPILPYGCITLPVTFGTAENYRTELVVFDIADFHLPFNAILGRPALHQFMAVAHYGYLVLKMPAPKGVISEHTDRVAAAAVVEKLQALAAAQEADQEIQDADPPRSRLCVAAPRPSAEGRNAPEGSRGGPSQAAPRVRLDGADAVPTKIVQIGVEASQTTRISAGLGDE